MPGAQLCADAPPRGATEKAAVVELAACPDSSSATAAATLFSQLLDSFVLGTACSQVHAARESVVLRHGRNEGAVSLVPQFSTLPHHGAAMSSSPCTASVYDICGDLTRDRVLGSLVSCIGTAGFLSLRSQVLTPDRFRVTSVDRYHTKTYVDYDQGAFSPMWCATQESGAAPLLLGCRV